MAKPRRPVQPDDAYRIWVGGSTDYAHKDRPGAAAYIIEHEGRTVDTYIETDWNTTEFRMILTVILHAMRTLPEGSLLIFLTNVAYIQNFDKPPTDKSANADLIEQCIALKSQHSSVSVQLVTYHKFPNLLATHQMAHEAMLRLRRASSLL